jgi:soluble lytic murein transglycosylase
VVLLAFFAAATWRTEARAESTKPEAIAIVQTAREKELAGDYAGAAALFAQAAETYPPTADGALDEAARLRLAAADWPGAIETLTLLRERFPTAAAAREVLPRLAKAYEKNGDLAAAAPLYLAAASAASATRETQYLIRAAECQIRLGDRQAALHLLDRALDVASPNRFTVRALRLRLDLTAHGDSAAQAEGAAQLGMRLFQRGAWEQAGAALDDAVRLFAEAGRPLPSGDERFRAAATALMQTHHDDDALTYWKQIAAAGGASAEDFHNLAKLYSRTGDSDGARQAYRAMAHLVGDRGFHNALYQLAWLDIEEGNYGAAYKYFDNRLREPGGKSDLVRWLAGWTAYRAGWIKTALVHLATAGGGRKDGDANRAAYWRGRILLESGQKKAGVKLLQAVNKKSPDDFFGWQAAALLRASNAAYVGLRSLVGGRRAGGAQLHRAPDGWWNAYKELKDRVGHARDLADVGLWRAASAELAGIELPKKLPPAHWYELARLFHDAHRYDLARNPTCRAAAMAFLKQTSEPLARTFYPLFMPLGYDELVLHYAARFQVPPALVFAVIQQESNYRPDVVSPAHAVGLMQLLPQTGAEVAAALGESYDEDSLYDPETNIRYGCRYLRQLLEQLGSEPAYAIAAYNGGPKATGKWLRNKPGSSDAVFVAEIPYMETNHYVRNVLTAMKKYEALLQELESLK